MKIRSTILSILVLLSILLSACQTAPAASGKIAFMVSGDPADQAAYQKLVDAFQKGHPQVMVELINIPKSGDYSKRLAADIAAGTPADVVIINYRSQAGFAKSGALEPLDAYLAQSTLVKEADFYPQAFNAFKWNGKQTCIPQNISSLVVYYNKDLFTKAGVAFPAAGWTWDDFNAAAQKLTLDTNGDGKTDQFGAGIASELIRIAPFIWQAGGEIVDGDITPSTLTIDTPEGLQAADFFFGLQTKLHVVPNAEEEASEDSESRFVNGRTAMFFNSRKGVPMYRESAKFDWDVAALPQGKSAATVLHSDGYCLPSGSKNKTAAWALIEFANSVEGQTIISQTGRTVPSNKAVASSPAFLSPDTKPASSQIFLDVIPSIRALPLFPGWMEVEELADAEMTRGFYGQASPEEALKAATERTLEVFKEK